MAGAPRPPAPSPAPGPSAPRDPRVCPGCGWQNAAAAERCEFCRMPFDRPKPRPLPASVRCPHCGAENLAVAAAAVECPDCSRRYDEPTSVAGKAQAVASRASRGIEVPWRLVVFLVIAGTGIGLFLFQFAAHRRATSADHVRQLKRHLEIYAAEVGGYPSSFADLERRYGRVPAYLRNDAWGNEIAYRTRGARHEMPYEGIAVHDGCELRCFGPNGRPGDADDIVWAGGAR